MYGDGAGGSWAAGCLGYTSESSLTSRLFSAAWMLDPLALAPETLATVATYSPLDWSTLAEYWVPPTDRE